MLGEWVVGFHFGVILLIRAAVSLRHSCGWGHLLVAQVVLQSSQVQLIHDKWVSGILSSRESVSLTSLCHGFS